jgi:hypothetical protein
MAKEKSGNITVEFRPEWLDYIMPEKFNSPELNRIVTFFVFHSPCRQLSAMSKSLEEYGWNAPWKKPQYLQRKLKATSTNNGLIFSAQTIGDMRQALEKSRLMGNLTDDLNTERIAIFNNQRNQFMSVFYHLRDAFAHGRLNMFDIGLEDDYVFLFEDVRKNKSVYQVTARMILRKNTLLNWIELIEGGYIENDRTNDDKDIQGGMMSDKC